MGSSFYLGWLIPRETSLVIWGFEEKGQRFKGSSVKTSFPFTDYYQNDSQEEGIPLRKAPVCETRKIKLKCACSG
jgi:hypothetical protein